MNSRDQKGFTLVEVTLTVLMLGVFGVVGFYAYQNMQKSKNAVSNVASNPTSTPTVALGSSFTENGGYFSLKYPTGWVAKTIGTPGGGAFAIEPAENAITYIASTQAGADSDDMLNVSVYKADPDLEAFEKKEQSDAQANHRIITDLTINGQKAFLENESYYKDKSLIYYVGHGATIVSIDINVATPETHIDNTKYIPQLTAIAKSLTILK